MKGSGKGVFFIPNNIPFSVIKGMLSDEKVKLL